MGSHHVTATAEGKLGIPTNERYYSKIMSNRYGDELLKKRRDL